MTAAGLLLQAFTVMRQNPRLSWKKKKKKACGGKDAPITVWNYIHQLEGKGRVNTHPQLEDHGPALIQTMTHEIKQAHLTTPR